MLLTNAWSAVCTSDDRNQSFSVKYNLLWDKILGTALFDDAIQTECAAYEQVVAHYNLTNGWVFEGDVESLDAGKFPAAGEWQSWFVPLCGHEASRKHYAELMACQRTTLLPSGQCLSCPVTNLSGADALGQPGHCGLGVRALGDGADGSLWSIMALHKYAGKFKNE